MSRENESTESQHQTKESGSKGGAFKKVARGTLKVATKVSGADVLFKDAKRLRPRHPQLWKDVFSAPSKLRQQGLPDNDRERTPVPRAAVNALITALVGVGVVIYGLILINASQSPGDLPLVNKIGMSGLIVLGLFQACIYGWITLKLLHRRHLSSATHARATTAKTRSKGQ